MAPVPVPAGTVIDGNTEATAENLGALLVAANGRLCQSGAWYDGVRGGYASPVAAKPRTGREACQ